MQTSIEVQLVGFNQAREDEDDYDERFSESTEQGIEKVEYDQAASLSSQASNLERLAFGAEWSRRLNIERARESTVVDTQPESGERTECVGYIQNFRLFGTSPRMQSGRRSTVDLFAVPWLTSHLLHLQHPPLNLCSYSFVVLSNTSLR